MKKIKNLSKVTGPLMSEEITRAYISKSQKLFSELGLTLFKTGVGSLSPMLVKSLEKLKALVRTEMEQISALEFMLPILTPTDLLKTSGRMDLCDLFKVNENSDSGKYILSPTCEESAVNFIQSFPNLSWKNLPYRFYQISPKFRNEKRAKSGLLRSKEFLMKDLYCFDPDLKSSEICYEEVIGSYHNLFKKLQVPYICAKGDTGNFGGLYSHEFHFLADAGEDDILLCQECNYCENLSSENEKKEKKCGACNSNNVKLEKGIEVGHAFNLGTKYTEKFNTKYKNSKLKSEFLYMSCFGLGLTRILAASVEVLCTPTEIVWPIALAPYLVCVVPPKSGSVEEAAAKGVSEVIYHNLNQCLKDDVVYDDRTLLTIGNRLKYIKKIGFCYAVIIGKNICESPPLVEVVDIYNNSKDLIQIPDVSQYIMNKLYLGSDSNMNKINKACTGN